MADTQTQTQDPNVTLNGVTPAPEEQSGFFAAVKRQFTVRNSIIAGAVALVGTAIYLAVTSGNGVPEVTPTA